MRGTKRRAITVVVLTTALAAPGVASALEPAAAVSPFTDVANTDEFVEAVVWLAEQDITRGCNPPANDRFCPNDPVTRGQMAAFLVRAFGYSDRGSRDFGDDDSSVFEADIERLAAAGVTLGCNPPANDRFCPNDPVTRGQMAAFLVRAFGYSDRGSRDFGDDDSSVFEADIERLAAAGVTLGCNPPANDRFCPSDPVTRGQMAAFLWRANGEPDPGNGGGGGGTDDPGPRTFPRTPERAGDVIVEPGDNVQSIVDAAAAGATIRFRAGTYRLAQIAPKSDMQMIADPGVVLNGSKVLGDDETWVVDGSRWYVGGQTQGSTTPVQGEEWGYCDDGRPACVYPEDLFVDGEPLTRVATLDDVGTGEWYFDYAADRIYTGTNPSGRTVEVSVSSWAFHGSSDRVRIEGFTIIQYATPGRQGAINPRVGRAGANGVDWEVVGNTVRHGHAWGIKIEHGMIATDNVTDANGQGGIGGVGDDVLIEHNEITGNCIAGYLCFGWEGGATKFVTNGMVISDNIVSDNLGHGIHPDILSTDIVIEENVVERNLGVGIHYETSSDAVIADNVVNGNGFKLDGSREPGILVLNSVRIDITGNQLDGNALGILLRQDDRTDRGIVSDVLVSGNTVAGGTSSRSGIGSVTIDTGLLGPITFQSNTYRYVDERPFTFDGTTYTPAGWQGLGYDAGSSFTRQ